MVDVLLDHDKLGASIDMLGLSDTIRNEDDAEDAMDLSAPTPKLGSATPWQQFGNMSPEFDTMSGNFTPQVNTPYVDPNSTPYISASPGYQSPYSPNYQPSPAYRSVSPAYMDGSAKYSPTSPIYSPTSPAYSPTSPAYSPTS